MSAKKVLNNLQKNIYCRIRCSKIHGVGVVAIRDIPKGINPYLLATKSQKTVGILDKDIEKLEPEVKAMVHDFFQKEDDDKWYLPVSGLNSIDSSFYMNNNSSNPNVKVLDADESFVTFRTLRKIKKGEELTINYNS
tara:strand:+ start:1986 stop:2396 length:411 start_codon:yes stop_codon:yes gene_type:complete